MFPPKFLESNFLKSLPDQSINQPIDSSEKKNVRSAAGKNEHGAIIIVFHAGAFFLSTPFLQSETEISGPSLYQVSSLYNHISL